MIVSALGLNTKGLLMPQPYTAVTRVFVVNPYYPETDAIQVGAEAIQSGGLVAFPTETVYGLGANALNPEAIRRIYSAKGRPANNPLIVHIAALAQLEQVAVAIPDIAAQLVEQFWPGPLTLVLKRSVEISPNVSAGRDTVAVRMPAHAVALALIKAAGVPIAAPSANLFTRPSATTAEHVLTDLNGHVDVILDGGATRIGLESTVIDLTAETPIVLRPGGVTLESLGAIFPVIELYRQSALLTDDEATSSPASPGMLAKHYSPDAELVLFNGSFEAVMARMRQSARKMLAEGQHVGVLVVDEDRPQFEDLAEQLVVISLGSKTNLDQVGHSLFAALRALDAQHVDVILAHSFEESGLGATIVDRLRRAAEGRVIDVED
jgi:L-threonylcarbamoyladenylate synthase